MTVWITGTASQPAEPHSNPEHRQILPNAYVVQWCVREQGESLKKVLVVVVLDDGRPVRLQTDSGGIERKHEKGEYTQQQGETGPTRKLVGGETVIL